MIKFLKESEYDINDDELGIDGKCAQYESSQQAHMLELLSETDIDSRIRLGKYALSNCVTELKVHGTVIDHKRMAKFGDLSDNDTLKIYLAVGELCALANKLSEIQEKK